jgi:hypothetical protein
VARTAIVESGFRIVVRTNDHAPAHAHVIRDGADLRVYLSGNRPAERVIGRMRHVDEQKAIRLVAKHRALLLVIWRRFHP